MLKFRSRLSKAVPPSKRVNATIVTNFGHLIATCPSLKKRGKTKFTKSVGFIQKLDAQAGSSIDAAYDPFVCQGMISLSGLDQDMVSIAMLRDTGSNQSFVLASFLPFSEESYCGSDILVQGMSWVC